MSYLSILKTLNKIFPPKQYEGRKSTQEYSLAEYGWAKRDYELYKDLLPLESKVVLDAGCGLGGRTAYYSEKGAASIVGIDMDENHIKFSKEFAAFKELKNATFLVANFINIPFESNHFDVIILNDVLEHIRIDYLEQALPELRRVLKPGGKLFLEFPPWTSPYAAHLYDQISMPWCQYLFPEKALIQYIEKYNTGNRNGTLSPVEHFKELNRLNKKPFIQLMKKSGLVEIHFQQKIIKNMNFLKVIPFLNEFATNRIVGIYTKKDADK